VADSRLQLFHSLSLFRELDTLAAGGVTFSCKLRTPMWGMDARISIVRTCDTTLLPECYGEGDSNAKTMADVVGWDQPCDRGRLSWGGRATAFEGWAGELVG